MFIVYALDHCWACSINLELIISVTILRASMFLVSRGQTAIFLFVGAGKK